MTRWNALLRSFVLALALSPAAQAQTIVLDGSTGADYDAVGDGWLFGSFDGVGDLGNQSLAVGLISGTLELRALSEFPLAPLAGVTSAEVASATVTITIDDILSTFGPGAVFDNTANDPIAAYYYPADGTVAVADFAPAGLVQLGLVNPGTVTDASLAVSGALSFTVDATAQVRAALDAGTVAFGLLLGTTDSGAATSLDNLSPPGVAGGKLPTLTIELADPPAPPVLDPSAQSCQGSIAKAATKLISSEMKAFSSCFGLVLKDIEKDGAASAKTVATCAAQLDTAVPTSKLAKAIATYDTKVAKTCTGLTPDALETPCDAGAATIEATLACVKAAHLETGQHLVDTQYTGACELLGAVGLAAAFPEVCS